MGPYILLVTVWIIHNGGVGISTTTIQTLNRESCMGAKAVVDRQPNTSSTCVPTYTPKAAR